MSHTSEQMLMLMGVVAPGVLPVPQYCSTCGNDPKDDLHPRIGELCFWCEELRAIHRAAVDRVVRAGVRKIETRRAGGGSGTLSSGPRRAPAIPTVSVRQHHTIGFADWVYIATLSSYVVLLFVWVGVMHR